MLGFQGCLACLIDLGIAFSVSYLDMVTWMPTPRIQPRASCITRLVYAFAIWKATLAHGMPRGTSLRSRCTLLRYALHLSSVFVSYFAIVMLMLALRSSNRPVAANVLSWIDPCSLVSVRRITRLRMNMTCVFLDAMFFS